jgi:hypothetical protein
MFSIRLALSLVPLVATLPAFAQSTWHVGSNPNPPGTGTPSDPYTSIQYAITRPATLSGDTLLVAAGATYPETLDTSGKSLTLRAAWGGPGPAPYAVVDAQQLGPCLQIGNGETVVLEGLRLTGGASPTGGGLCLTSGNATLRGCRIDGNVATQVGGGVWVDVLAAATLEHCVIADNEVTSPTGHGGGVAVHAPSAVLRRCTLWGNVAPSGGGVSFEQHLATPPLLESSIVCENEGGEILVIAGMADVRWSNVRGGAAGTGNSSADPVFWNRWAGDFRLNYGSPCIDAGDPTAVLDPDGSRADVGAHAFEGGNLNGPFAFCAGDGLDPQVGVACPCLNFGAPGHGCASSRDPHGAVLTLSGLPQANAIVLHGYGMPATTNVLFLKSDFSITAATGLAFGDGISCLTGTLVRLGVKGNAGGQAHYPEAGDPLLSTQSGTFPGSGLAATYQIHYRNPAAYCPPSTSNMTNAVLLVW